ncbi:MAG: PEP-utilizing enzyme [Parcubacteria group bacterium]
MINPNQLNPEDFIKYFRTDGLIGCMHSEFLLEGPLGQDMLVMNQNMVFYSYISRRHEKDWAEQGLELYGNQEEFNGYIEEYKEYIREAKSGIIKDFKKVPENLTKEEFIDARNFMGLLWKRYGFLEAYFQEYAYAVAQKNDNKVIKKNLDYAGRFKFEVREIMNDYYFRGGVLENIYKYFSRKYDVKAEYLYTDEIRGLFDGHMPPKDYERREKCYAATNHKGKLAVFPYQEAKNIFDRFAERVNRKIVKGVSASRGMVSGKAVVVPMFDNHKQIMEIDKIMKKGDILIAETTSPEVLLLCKKAAAIVTNTGGMLSHAAVVSRELNIPCIVNTVNATLSFKTGDEVEVDADKGVVKILKRASEE